MTQKQWLASGLFALLFGMGISAWPLARLLVANNAPWESPKHGNISSQDDAIIQSISSTAQDEKNVMVKVKVFNKNGQLVGPIEMSKVVKSDDEWRRILTPEQFKIARAKGTERPFCGALLDNKKEGVYACVCCRLPLFASDAKFNSGTGWPSFFQPIASENVATKMDYSHGMQRVEILCARCDCHLGHVFDDGPRPTGLRFCVNSESLTFTEIGEIATLADEAVHTDSADKSKQARPRD